MLSRISRVLTVTNPILVTTVATVKVSGVQVLAYRTLVLQALKSEDIYWLEEGQESDLMVLCAIE